MQAMRIFFRMLLMVLSATHLQAVAGNHENGKHADMPSGETVIELEIDGPVGPATADYIVRHLDKAAQMNAMAVIIRIDTPGGLDTAMRDIIKRIIASSVPVVGYVAPGGARAASAGTYILYASHIAAMAPATNLGAATPVALFDSGDQADEKSGAEETDSPPEPPAAFQNPMAHKAVNDAVAYIRGLAKMRGRNEEWAEQAVRQAASLPSAEALKLNVIDLIAETPEALLDRIDGRKVNILGQERTLATANARIDKLYPDWRSQLLAVMTNPNVAYILMLIGIYGLVFEFSNPGSIVPGTLGAISLLLALFAFQVLPVNYAGVALMLLGMGLMIAEAFVPNIGMLGLGGVAAFVFGSVILIDTDAPGFGINPGVIGGFACVSLLFIGLTLTFLLKSRRRPVVSGREQLVAQSGVALDDFSETGLIRIHGETWRASTDRAVRKHDRVVVRAVDGLTLLITPEKQEE